MYINALGAIQACIFFYRLTSTHVSDLPRLAGASLSLRLIRHIFEPPCSTEYKICSSKWCSTALPLLFFFDSLTKGFLGVCIFLVIVSSIGETNARFAALTLPALLYAIALITLVVLKALFNSSGRVRSNEVLILAGNGFGCIALFLHALRFDQRPTEEDRTIKFTRRFTIWLCKLHIATITGWAACLTVQRFHEWRKHSPNEALLTRRLAELHGTFKDIRMARYGGLTSISVPQGFHKVGDSCTYFPKDKLPVGRSLSRPLVETNEAQLPPQFLRCSCCIDDSCHSYPVPTELGNQQKEYIPQHLEPRSNIRSEFLARPKWQHFSPNANEAAPATIKPHSLCNVCQWICCASSIIQSRSSYNPSRHFGLYIRKRECFEHHSTAQGLLASVKNGCHLCTLIWTSMSPTQRGSLLATDATLQHQLEEDLAMALEDNERNTLKKRYHCRRRIRLAVESFDSDIPPNDSQLKQAHSLEVGKGAAQLVPHFGGLKRPRRWMFKIRDFEDHMLMEQGESEFAPPILMLRSNSEAAGPIEMPFSDSTGSGYAMSLIKRWLQDTEPTEATGFLPGRLLHVGLALKFGIIRVIDKSEIRAQVLASRNIGHDLLEEVECDHKFAMGCLSTNGQQCCLCRAGGWEQNNIQMNQFSYCTRCETYLKSGGAREYKLHRIGISKDPNNLHYVALSHCWGENPTFLKLTKENQHSLRLGVPIARLTKSFQEAIITVASLEYSFIWIDSLCIIQDSSEDWKQESVTMRDIYKNATFTIVASAAWSGKEGLFRAQDPLSNHPCVLGVRIHEGDTRVTYAIPAQMDIEKTRRVELELCKWNRRGWCLQERALSRRIVFFGESQLHFELKNDSGAVVHLKSQGNERAYFKPNRSRPGSSVAMSYSSHMWWEFVNSYTQRQLTYRSDRPLAIQGLAASMESAGIPMFLPTLRSEINLRGSTSNSFVASLLWYIDKDRTSRPSGKTDNFPTWSWLSVDGVIFNDSVGEVHETSTLSVKELIEPEDIRDGDGNNNQHIMFAAGIRGLQLRVSGKVRRARWEVVPDQFYFARRRGVDTLCLNPPGYRDLELFTARQLQEGNGIDPGWWPRSEGKFEYLEMVKPISNDAGMGPRVHVLQTPERIPIGWLVPDTTDALPEDIYCLQIRVEPATPVEKYKITNTWAVRGLALARVESFSNIDLPVYSRVGYFELDQKRNGFLYTDLAFDWRFSSLERKDLRNNFLRKWPDVDPRGFFEDVIEQQFIIV